VNIPEAMKILNPLLPRSTGSNCFTWSDLCAIAQEIDSLRHLVRGFTMPQERPHEQG
jgi:hypothetical protein